MATVDENGKVTAVSPGEATITATTEDGSYTDTCTVTVNKRIIDVTGITVSPESLTLTEGETGDLTAAIEPEDADNKNVTWSSSDEAVATVDENGKVTGVSEGTAIVRAVSEANPEAVAECTVTVQKPKLEIKISHICSVQNNLTLKYRIDQNQLEGYENIRIKIRRQSYTGAGSEYIWEEAELTEYKIESGMYSFAFNDIAAAEMGEEIHAVVYAEKDGQTYASQEDVYSIKKYAYNMINRYGSSEEEKYKKLCTLLVDMLNYGSQAQLYFRKNTANPVNAELTEEQRAFATAEIPEYSSCESETEYEGATASIRSKTLNLGSSVSLKLFMTFESEPGEDVKAEFSYTTISGRSEKKTVSRSQFAEGTEENEYTAMLSTIAAPDFGQEITIVIKDGEQQISNEYTYSIETYAYKMSDREGYETLKELLRAMMTYSASAKAYFQ